MKTSTITRLRSLSLLLLLQLSAVVFGQGLGKNPAGPQNNVIFPGNSDVRLSVTRLNDLCFGAFYPGKFGGVVTVDKNGMRSAKGSVVLMNSELIPSPAVFEIRCPGNTMVNVFVEENIVLKNELNTEINCEIIDDGSSYFISPTNAQAGFQYSVGAEINTSSNTLIGSGEFSGTISITVVLE